METLAIVLALLFIGMAVDLKGVRVYFFSAMTISFSFFGALAVGIYVAVAG